MSIRKSSKPSKRLRDEHAEATRAAIVTAARARFAENGYAGTSLDDIALAAGATKGAVYHHFRDKRDLFRAVYDELARELVEAIVRRQSAGPDAREALRAFLAQGKDETVRRVLFHDGPVVLGAECRAIDAKYGLGMLTALVRGTSSPALLAEAEPETVAKLLLALAIEAAQIIGSASDPRGATREVEAVMSRVLAALAQP